MRFSVKGVQIELHYSFLLIVAFAMLIGGYDFIYILLFSCLHELGHIFVLYLLGGRAERIVLSCCGIGLSHRCRLSALREFIFLISGLIVNLIFAIFGVKAEINLALLVVNSIPIYPLDGGRIVKLVLNNVFCLSVSDKIYKAVSAVIIVLLLVLAIYLQNLSLILIVAYVVMYSINNSIN